MALFYKDKRICRKVCWLPPVAGNEVGVGIIAIAILVFIAIVFIF